MANYPYIIASFPDLLLDFEQHPIDPHTAVTEVKSQLSESDGKLVDWLLFGLNGAHLTPHFYRNVKQARNRFLLDWFEFDRKLRLAKVAYLEGSRSKKNSRNSTRRKSFSRSPIFSSAKNCSTGSAGTRRPNWWTSIS